MHGQKRLFSMPALAESAWQWNLQKCNVGNLVNGGIQGIRVVYVTKDRFKYCAGSTCNSMPVCSVCEAANLAAFVIGFVVGEDIYIMQKTIIM